jgi:hypothetical protein
VHNDAVFIQCPFSVSVSLAYCVLFTSGVERISGRHRCNQELFICHSPSRLNESFAMPSKNTGEVESTTPEENHVLLK